MIKNISYANHRRYNKLDVMYQVEKQNLPCVIYFHGGGWTTYDKSIFRTTCKKICQQNTVVFNCNHRLAPKFTVWDMVADVVDAIQFVRQNAKQFGGDASKIFLAGDSSGAHVVTLAVSKLAQENVDISFIKGLVSFYGAFDLSALQTVNFKHIKQYLTAITAHGDSLKSISPTEYVSNKMPPIWFCSGKIDLLHDCQTVRYMHLLHEQGVKTQAVFFEKDNFDAQHRFITSVRTTTAQFAIEQMGLFVKNAVKD